MNKTAYSYSTPKHNYYAPLSKRFPEDIECIITSQHRDRGNLYISNIQAAQNPTTLQKYSIKAILSCAKGYELNHSKHIVAHYHYIPATDHQNCDIYPHFNQAADFIQKNLMNTNVLVHCVAGVSRSVSMVIAYLIREHKLTDEQAFRLVKSRRKIINPNQGFRSQLKQYYKQASSRPFKQMSSEKSIKTPQKKTNQDSKQSPKKFSLTSSTYIKSSEADKDKYVKKNQLNDRNLLLDYKHTEIVIPAKTQRKSFEEKQTLKYYSPVKLSTYNRVYQQTDVDLKGSRGYIHNLSQDLDHRIEKIKQKYEMHRLQLQQRYPKSIFNDHFDLAYSSKDKQLQNSFADRKLERLKTQSFHDYTRPNYLNQYDKDYMLSKNSYPSVDTLASKAFIVDLTQAAPQFNQKEIHNRAMLDRNSYKQTQAASIGSNNYMRLYTYNTFKNSYNRDGFKKFL